MAKNRIIKFLEILSKVYLFFAIPFVVFLIVFYGWEHVTDYDEYCTYVLSGEFYHLLLEGGGRCKINWFALLFMLVAMLIVYPIVFICPALVIGFILRKVEKDK